MTKQEQIEEIAEVIANMEKRNAHYYTKGMQEREAFADCNNIAEALYNAGCRIYTKEQLELYKFYDIEEARYQRQLAHEKKDAEINKINRERAARCEGCNHSRIFSYGDGFKFLGCFHKPYKGKWCIEIVDCPEEIKSNKKD